MYSTFNQAVVVNLTNFDVYDQIVTVLLPSNRFLTFIALGTKKITSKNAHSLAYLNLIDVDVFLARNPQKLSRLKTASLVEQFNFSNLKKFTFRYFIRYLSVEKNLEQDFYTFFLSCLKDLKQNRFNDQLSSLKLLVLIYKNLGLRFIFNCCVKCGNKKVRTISIKHNGMVCLKCNERELIYPKTFLKNFYYLINNPNKIKFIDQEETNFFFFYAIKILTALIDNNAGIKLD